MDDSSGVVLNCSSLQIWLKQLLITVNAESTKGTTVESREHELESNLNHDDSPPEEEKAENIVVEDVYCKFMSKDIDENNELLPLNLHSRQSQQVRLDALKTFHKVNFYLQFVPYITLSYGFLY